MKDNAEECCTPIDIAIVGGGIAGLYCAYKYSGTRTITLFESTLKVGGRICTHPVGFDHQPSSLLALGDRAKPGYGLSSEPDLSKDWFYPEYGPMRIEPEHQELLRGLLNELGIVTNTKGDAADQTPKLVDFPAYASPLSDFEPQYVLAGEEKDQETPLDLMKLGFVRILGKLSMDSMGSGNKQHWDSFEARVVGILDDLKAAVATRQHDWQSILQRWIDSLHDEDYQNLREFAAIEFKFEANSTLEKIPLHQMGFWNLLSEVLSHNAVMKLRDIGTFYHLLPENPNGAEWLVFWLRALKTTERLQGIDKGMKHIWCGLEKKLKDKRIEPIKDATLVSIKPKGELVTLGFKFSDKEKLSYYTAKSVILAIPKAPLEKIVLGNRGVFSESICKEIDGVFGFSLVKIFVVVKKRWWEEDQRANVGATSIPTRELHYWKSLTPGSARGMIMIYTDRPGSIFWTNYVGTRGRQEGPFTNRDQDIGDVFKSTQMKRLKAKVVEVLKEAGAGNLKVSDVEYCGIMDWGREPYGGASHAWRPERRPSDVLTSLSSFNLGLEPQNAEGKGTIHICGEAYSDYQGFIEGALRSAAHVLHRIDPAHRLVVDTTVCAEDRREIKTLTPRFCPCCTAAPARPQSAS